MSLGLKTKNGPVVDAIIGFLELRTIRQAAMNAPDPKRIDQARNTPLSLDNLRIAIDDLGPIGDDPKIHLVRFNGRFFRVRGSLLTAVQNDTIDELNPRELAELHRFKRSMVSPARTDAGVSHIKLRTDFPLTLLLRGFAQMTSVLARYPLITGASVVVVAALVLTRCATSDRIPHLDGIVVLGAFAIRLMSTLLHEIGHLSVARHFGAPANRMGVGLWWGLFPAFYADVTSAWLLSRKQRIAVTLAGPFFTLVSMIPIGIGSLALHGPVGDACFVALVMSGTSFVFNPYVGFRVSSAELRGITDSQPVPVTKGGAYLPPIHERSLNNDVIIDLK